MQHYKQLTYEQRYAIEVMLQKGVSKKEVAEGIGKNESTIHREVNRNMKLRGSYRAAHAQKLADERKKEGHYKRKLDDSMMRMIDDKLSKQWSPEQIKGYCDLNKIEMVSHERIYQYIWEEKRNGGMLYTHLRNSGKRFDTPLPKVKGFLHHV